MIKLSVKGVDKAMAQVKRLAKEFPKAAAFALNRRGEIIMTDSKKNYVPVDEGELRASGHVVTEKAELRTTLGFGGPAGIGNQGRSNKEDVGYAVRQHETTSYQHTVGTSKYLEKPLMAAVGTLAADLGRDIKAKVGLS